MVTRAVLVLAFIVPAACSSASPAPKGWQPVPGASRAWSRQGPAGPQEYSYSSKSFDGALQDLASQTTVDVLTHYAGTRLRSSLPFAPCPGAAGVATFTLRSNRALQEGFAVRDGQAIRSIYIRPANEPPDPNVVAAMQAVLC